MSVYGLCSLCLSHSLSESKKGSTMTDKKRYTVSSPPRVHEVARAIGYDSKYTIVLLQHYTGKEFRTASHRVPLSIAIGFIDWLRKL